MEDEQLIGVTVLSNGGRTVVPKQVLEFLDLRYYSGSRQKLLWTHEDLDVTVKKGTPQSSFRKTMLGSGGKVAVPKHIQKALNLKSPLTRKDWHG